MMSTAFPHHASANQTTWATALSDHLSDLAKLRLIQVDVCRDDNKRCIFPFQTGSVRSLS